jgi:hypothetical protein
MPYVTREEAQAIGIFYRLSCLETNVDSELKLHEILDVLKSIKRSGDISLLVKRDVFLLGTQLQRDLNNIRLFKNEVNGDDTETQQFNDLKSVLIALKIYQLSCIGQKLYNILDDEDDQPVINALSLHVIDEQQIKGWSVNRIKELAAAQLQNMLSIEDIDKFNALSTEEKRCVLIHTPTVKLEAMQIIVSNILKMQSQQQRIAAFKNIAEIEKQMARGKLWLDILHDINHC